MKLDGTITPMQPVPGGGRDLSQLEPIGTGALCTTDGFCYPDDAGEPAAPATETPASSPTAEEAGSTSNLEPSS